MGRFASLSARQIHEAVLVMGAMFRVALKRLPDQSEIRRLMHHAVDRRTGEVTQVSLQSLARIVVRSDEFTRLYERKDVTASGNAELKQRFCDDLARLARLPENHIGIIPFQLCYPESASPGYDRAYALWFLSVVQAETGSGLKKTSRNRLSFDVYMNVGDESVEAARLTLNALYGQNDADWTLHVAASAETFQHLLSTAAQRCIRRTEEPLEGVAPYLAFIEPGDTLADGALVRIASVLETQPETVLLFTDEDRIDRRGNHVGACLKPGWSDDQLLLGDTLGQFCVFSRRRVQDVMEQLGDVEGLYDPRMTSACWLYALKLAVVEGVEPRRVVHLPVVLFHRFREEPDGVLLRSRLRRLAEKHLARHRPEVVLTEMALVPERVGNQSHVRVCYPLPPEPPLVSIIIPTKDRPDFLRLCLRGLLTETDYPHFEIIVVDNGSVRPDTLALLEDLSRHPAVTVLRQEGAFNWAWLNNQAAARSRGEMLLLLNDDVRILHPDWLEELVRQCLRPGVGVVGARLLYPDGTIQHAGVMLSRDGATHLLRGAKAQDTGYLNALTCQRDLSAVTGACLMIRRDVFDQIGGIDESFAVSCNDIDLCLRASAAGWRVVWTPYATLTHVDGGTRGRDASPAQILQHWQETARLVGRWKGWMECDFALNPALRVTDDALLLRYPCPFDTMNG
ncbi:glycosyltransferase family 2 protein [Acetobacter sp.]|jgi:GT2 family glycosyltransferase|uniref:glycosyltransferase family 2 protein n=1 Tax=Acetobacter sp. TaxID=440 RepID=UPI0025BFE68A|nr:glycosyltransferase family 2 protein [Acetobacter sp.]MCH4091489.1 glycosyltransferase family 2 protein [Acetobacter sp.]MCI1299467.1 glycosyltransferase family 2 protein [Acetobacter sp.]MCI1316943.1 glycosyltransferase family 2 protein [Acetobacter sp.]